MAFPITPERAQSQDRTLKRAPHLERQIGPDQDQAQDAAGPGQAEKALGAQDAREAVGKQRRHRVGNKQQIDHREFADRRAGPKRIGAQELQQHDLRRAQAGQDAPADHQHRTRIEPRVDPNQIGHGQPGDAVEALLQESVVVALAASPAIL